MAAQAKSPRLYWQADDHHWGRGKIHIIDDDGTKLVCGRLLANTPGHRIPAPAGGHTCKNCTDALVRREEQERRRREWEERQRRIAQMNAPGPIETSYKGYRFRSRLEARWAVFFDKMKVRWEYEKEGYRLSDGTCYLPDFWLPTMNLWIEVKGRPPEAVELKKCELLRDLTGAAVAIFSGMPGEELGTLFCWDLGDSGGGASEWAVNLTNDGDGDLMMGVDTDRSLFADAAFSRDIWWGPACGGMVEIAADLARAARFEHGEGGGSL